MQNKELITLTLAAGQQRIFKAGVYPKKIFRRLSELVLIEETGRAKKSRYQLQHLNRFLRRYLNQLASQHLQVSR